MIDYCEGMAHDINPIFKVELELPAAMATRFAVQPQYVISERMMAVVAGVLTEDQIEALRAAGVEFQPVVFPKQWEVVG